MVSSWLILCPFLHLWLTLHSDLELFFALTSGGSGFTSGRMTYVHGQKHYNYKKRSSRNDSCATRSDPAWRQRDAGTVTLRAMLFMFVFSGIVSCLVSFFITLFFTPLLLLSPLFFLGAMSGVSKQNSVWERLRASPK